MPGTWPLPQARRQETLRRRRRLRERFLRRRDLESAFSLAHVFLMGRAPELDGRRGDSARIALALGRKIAELRGVDASPEASCEGALAPGRASSGRALGPTPDHQRQNADAVMRGGWPILRARDDPEPVCCRSKTPASCRDCNAVCPPREPSTWPTPHGSFGKDPGQVSPPVQRIGMDLDNREQVAQAVQYRLHVARRMGGRSLRGECHFSADLEHLSHTPSELHNRAGIGGHPGHRIPGRSSQLVGRRQHGHFVHREGYRETAFGARHASKSRCRLDEPVLCGLFFVHDVGGL